jgi:hypothetical protein
MARDIHKMQRLARELLPNQTLPEGEVKVWSKPERSLAGTNSWQFPEKLISSPVWLRNPDCPQIKMLFE